MRFGQDVGVATLIWKSFSLWLLGYPEAALAGADDAHARSATLTRLRAPFCRPPVNVLVPRFRDVFLFRLADQKVVELLTFTHCSGEPPRLFPSSGPLFAMWPFVLWRNLISLSRSASVLVISRRDWTD